MKLVEILALNWSEWPVGVDAVGQWPNGEVCDLMPEDGWRHKTLGWFEFLASDSEYAEVTRDQWESERARIAKNDALEVARDAPPVSKYEQELWDKVAIDLYTKWSSWVDDSGGNDELLDAAFSREDAFMAERAKRMKG